MAAENPLTSLMYNCPANWTKIFFVCSANDIKIELSIMKPLMTPQLESQIKYSLTQRRNMLAQALEETTQLLNNIDALIKDPNQWDINALAQAYSQGFLARPNTVCPYKTTDDRFKSWMQGYKDKGIEALK